MIPLLLVGFEGLVAPAPLLDQIAASAVGGVVLFRRNLGSLDQVAALVAAIGDAAPGPLPPIVAVDQEGGRVQRLKDPLTVWPPMARLGEGDDVEASLAVGRALGAELRLLGINLDFAPVLDVHTNPDNPVIGDRAFATTPEGVARHALAFWRGLESAGVRGCGKHFPGHGDTRSDSHLDLPRIEAPLQRLREVELAPFAAAVAAGVGMIMTAHVVYGALDERPATMSRPCLDLLRRELGFEGVIVSDDLDMKAVAGRYPVRTIIREALAAGVDAFLACRDPAIQSQAAAALIEAATDPLLGAQVEAAMHRLGRFRATLAPARPASPEVRGQALPNPTHQALAARFAAMQRK